MTIINNSTSAFFERSILGMGALRQQAETLQKQLDTGQRLTQSSDDPVAASQMRQLQRADALAKIDTANADRAKTDLSLADTALTSISSYITRAKELATQAGNGTLSASQRASIGQELDQIHSGLVALANSRNSAGHALFGGQAAGNAYTLDASGNAVYAGTASWGNCPWATVKA